MEQRISLITLGVADMALCEKFYTALGWQKVDSQDGVIAFDLIGQVLGLYPRAKLAEDLGLEESALGKGGATLGYNVAEKAEVAAVIEAARAAGATILKEPQDVFWGGHHGFFSDPEGHIWEVAHNPFSKLGPKGEFRWQGY